MSYNAERLFSQSVHNLRRILPPSKTPGRDEALITVVFVMIAVEAFINELAEIARGEAHDEVMRTLGDVLRDAEAAKASIESKYQLASLVLNRKVFDRGQAPFQDFALLIKLRNAIVHARPDQSYREDEQGNLVDYENSILKALRQKGLAITRDEIREQIGVPPGAVLGSNWLQEISTRAVARWACVTAGAMVRAVIDALPDGDFALRIKQLYPAFLNVKTGV